jgi:PQQ-like domain
MSFRARPGLLASSRGARRLAPWILGVIGWSALATAGCGGEGQTSGAGGVSTSASSSSSSSVASSGSGLGGGASSSTSASSSGTGGASSSSTSASSSGVGGDAGSGNEDGGGDAAASDAGTDASDSTDAASDAGTDSGGASDAGSDGASGDAGTGSGDAGASDAGASDAGAGDAGASDAGTGDGGVPSACGDTSGLQHGAPWPMRGRCPTRIARADVAGPARANLKWSQAIYSSGNPNLNYGSVVSSPVVAADGTIYVGIGGSGLFPGGLLAFAPADGSLLWHYDTGASEVASGAVVRADGSVVFASDDGTAVALETTGQMRWSTPLGAKSFAPPLVGPDGTIYMGTDNGLTALHADGSVAWTQSLCADVSGGASLQADGSIVYSCQSVLWMTSPSGVAGSSLPVFHDYQAISAPPTVGPGGAVWYAASSVSGGTDSYATLYSYSPAAGFQYREFGWEAAAFSNSPALLANGDAITGAPYLMNGNKDGIVTAPITGGYTQGPSYPLGIQPQVTVDVAGNLYFVAGFTLVSLAPDLSPRWTATLDSEVQMGIAMGGDGTLYVGTVDGYLYAFAP